MPKLKSSKGLPLIVLLLLVLLVTVAVQLNREEPKKQERKHVSLIVYGDDSERWENLRQDAGLVCEQQNADLSILTMLTDNADEQKEIIEREIGNGADALLIAACDSTGIKEYINGRNIKIPFIFVEKSGKDEAFAENIQCIAPDDYKMGYDLGEAIVDNESDIVTVAVISDNMQRDSVALREQGLMDAIEGRVGKVITWNGNNRRKDARIRTFIQRELVSEATDVIVTFDNSTTDALLDALNNLNTSSKVYSISTSEKAVYNLYGKDIKVLAYPDEFAMGYLAAINVLDKQNAWIKYRNTGIEYRLVTKENMYDEDNQSLLFPFVN